MDKALDSGSPLSLPNLGRNPSPRRRSKNSSGEEPSCCFICSAPGPPRLVKEDTSYCLCYWVVPVVRVAANTSNICGAQAALVTSFPHPGGRSSCLHFADVETETRRGEVTSEVTALRSSRVEERSRASTPCPGTTCRNHP